MLPKSLPKKISLTLKLKPTELHEYLLTTLLVRERPSALKLKFSIGENRQPRGLPPPVLHTPMTN